MQRVDEMAAALLAQGIAQDALVQEKGRLQPAIPIHTPDGDVQGWFVPVVIGDRLVAFMQFNEAQALSRFSTFMRKPGDISGCPASADWLDVATIQRAVRSQLELGQHAGAPMLTYDHHPDRLVWSVPVMRADSLEGTIYVAGDYVYRAN